MPWPRRRACPRPRSAGRCMLDGDLGRTGGRGADRGRGRPGRPSASTCACARSSPCSRRRPPTWRRPRSPTGPVVGGVEARRRPHPGAPPRRRGPPVHPQPQRRHRAAPCRRRAAAVPAVRRVVLDGEMLGLREDERARGVPGHDEPVQRRRTVHARFFDCLHLDGDDLLDEPLAERLDALETRCRPWRMPASSPTTRRGARPSSTRPWPPATRA